MTSATLKAVSLLLNQMPMMRKIQQSMQGHGGCHPDRHNLSSFHKCSHGKISSPLTEISVGKTEKSGTEPARPLILTNRKFYKGYRGKERSRKPCQPGQPGYVKRP